MFAIEEFGTVDVFVNNAGLQRDAPFARPIPPSFRANSAKFFVDVIRIVEIEVGEARHGRRARPSA